jgi:hypothetical protein
MSLRLLKNNMKKRVKNLNLVDELNFFCDGCFVSTPVSKKGTIAIRMYDPIRRYKSSNNRMQHISSHKLCPKCFIRVSTQIGNIQITK